MIVDEFLLRYYYDLVTDLGYDIHVSNAIPETENYPYVVIGDVQCIERFNPCPLWICYVTLDIVTGAKSQIGRVQSLTMADAIHNAVKASAGHTSDGYKINSSYTTNSNPLDESDSISYVYRNVRTYVHQVSIVS
jgi:hypothetical protein